MDDTFPKLPNRLSHYSFLSSIYELGSTAVYKVLNSKDNKKYAMKVISASFTDEVLVETNTLSIVDNDYIVKTKEIYIDFDNSKTYCILEYAENTVGGFSNQLGANFSFLKRCVKETLLGLYYLHSKGIIHGDLKPANVFVVKDRFKIGDFGLSQYRKGTKTLIIQTPYYRAREIFMGKRDYTSAIDMWSFGMMLAELIMKKGLFDDNYDEEYFKDRYVKYDFLHLLNPIKKHPFYLMIVGCLHKDPKKRLTAKQILRSDLFNWKFDKIRKLSQKIIVVRDERLIRYIQKKIKNVYIIDRTFELYRKVITKLPKIEDEDFTHFLLDSCIRIMRYIYNINARDKTEKLIIEDITCEDVEIMDMVNYKMTD